MQFPDLPSVELVTSYVDRNAPERSPRRVRDPNRLYHTDSPSGLTQSGRVGPSHRQFSTISPDCPQLPPLNLSGNITLTEHSPSASDYPSSSRSTSALSGSSFRVSTQNSWSSRRSAAPTSVSSYTSLRLEIESQQSINANDVASGSQSRSLKGINPETLESMIQYLVYSTGRLRPLSH